MTIEMLPFFLDFLDKYGIAHRQGKGQWEVMQIMTADHGWQVIHKNKQNRLSIPDSLQNLVEQFNDYINS